MKLEGGGGGVGSILNMGLDLSLKEQKENEKMELLQFSTVHQKNPRPSFGEGGDHLWMAFCVSQRILRVVQLDEDVWLLQS